MAIIETEIWKANPDRPGTVIFDHSRPAQDVFNELETHLKADGRYPDEYFLFDARSNWKDGALFPKDGEIICNTNYGGNEGVYIDIFIRYEKDVYEFDKAAGEGKWEKRMVTEHFATGKTLGQTIEDLDRMNLVASSVMAAFYGMEREIRERYAQIENGTIAPRYPRPSAQQKLDETPTHDNTMILVTENHPQHENPKFIALAERLNQNFIDYQNVLDGFRVNEIVDMAGKIKAMSDAHSYMVMYHDFKDEELDFYLQFQNPLEIVGDILAKRNEDVGDVSFILDHIDGYRDDILEDYPLIDGISAAENSGLRRCMNIELELYLGKIAEKVITYHHKDWEIDAKILREAALSGNPEEKRFFWQVHSFGSNLAVERDTFIRDTLAFNTITEYRQSDPVIFGYYVEVTGMSGGEVKGNVFEIGDYAEFAEHIRETAEPLESLTLIYSDAWGENAGKAVTVSRREYDDDRHRLMSESGIVVEKIYHPQDKVRLAGLISKERANRKTLPIGSTSGLLRKMADKLSEAHIPLDITDKTVSTHPKPKTLAEKMQAANEKVKNQDEQGINIKPRKREERE